uniref:Uncharacterized protein n=1 Tax=Oryza nivara TaxID=4536 RepID=A0A0E0FIW9_ORYNI
MDRLSLVLAHLTLPSFGGKVKPQEDYHLNQSPLQACNAHLMAPSSSPPTPDCRIIAASGRPSGSPSLSPHPVAP